MGKESIDYYINMNDGISESKEALAKLRYVAKMSGNLHECNSDKNRTKANNMYFCEKVKPTLAQLKERDRLNQICRENGIEPIPEFEVEYRGALRSRIFRKTMELKDKGISFKSEDKVYCRDCKNFKCNIGSTGNCSISKRTTKSNWSCGNAEKK